MPTNLHKQCCLEKVCLKIVKFFFFLMTIIFSIFVTATFFWILSKFNPNIYRWSTEWANQKLLPIPTTCFIKEINSEDLYFSPGTKRYQATIKFDTNLESNVTILVYDPWQRVILTEVDDLAFNEKKDRPTLFTKPLYSSFIQFNILSPPKYIRLGNMEYQQSPFRVVIIEDQ